MSLDPRQMAERSSPIRPSPTRSARSTPPASRAPRSPGSSASATSTSATCLKATAQSGGYTLGRADLSGVRENAPPFERTEDEAASIEPRSPGAYWLRVRPDGSLLLPAEVAEALDAAPGERVFARLEAGALKIVSAETAMQQARDLVRRYVPAEVDLVEGLLARATRRDGRRAQRWLSSSWTPQPFWRICTVSWAARSSGAVLRASAISAVNLAEVIINLIDHGVPAEQAAFLTDQLGCEVLDADRRRAAAAGTLHARTRRTGVSLGDRFCLALAQELGLPALTSDRRWKDLDLGVEIQLIR